MATTPDDGILNPDGTWETDGTFDTYNRDDIWKAAREGRSLDVKKFLDRGTLPDVANHVGNTPLHMAAKNNYDGSTTAELLIMYGAQVNAQQRGYGSPLIYAASYRNYDTLNLLLQHKADPALRNYASGGTMLHILATQPNDSKKFEEIVQKCSVIINQQDHPREAATALHNAVAGRQIDNVKVLLDAKADCSIVNSHGETPLMLAEVLRYGKIAALIRDHLKRKAETDVSEKLESKSQKLF